MLHQTVFDLQARLSVNEYANNFFRIFDRTFDSYISASEHSGQNVGLANDHTILYVVGKVRIDNIKEKTSM